ncbi:MAG: hypothetical protein OIF48_18300 [Silicimonas sp.]|nr:hypothetical protein [Silicimonas sp.]
MLRLFQLLSVVLVLAGCAPRGEVLEATPVAVRALLAENRGKPYECVNFDPATDSCEAVSRIRLGRDRISLSTDFLLVGPVGETVRATIQSDFELNEGGYCGNLKNSRLRIDGNLTKVERAAFRDVFRVVSSATGDFCDRYFVDEFGRTFTLSFDKDGAARRESLSFVSYHRAPKRLRL